MATGIWILGDQLSHNQTALLQQQQNKENMPVILIESADYVRQRPYHYQKLMLVWSAMRHFAEELREDGWTVDYAIAPNFLSPLKNWVKKHQISEIVMVQPSDRPFAAFLNGLELDCSITFVENHNFLWTRSEFQAWATGRKRLVLEDFYRAGRKRFNILMDGKKPVGGKWNFDKDNRRPPKKNLNPPKPQWFEPDEITLAVMARIKSLDLQGYGQMEPFRWAVTHDQAMQVFQHFLATGLEKFGTFQDAMVTGEETLWHSLISPYVNIGLLNPLDLIKTVEAAYIDGDDSDIPINNIEGFIRQVLGWREYLYGIYHYVDEDYPEKNFFNHHMPLPDFFWDSSKTDLNCLKQCLSQTERTGYAHHIQRLMVLSNFALITGVNPQELEAWFHAAFIDAYDWVMQTNVIGMGQFADGGILASKPYAASANYINKMSNYCSSCRYNKGDRHGEDACPFNFFYWDFLDRHHTKLRSQGRMNLILKSLERMDEMELAKIRAQAAQWRQRLSPATGEPTIG